MPTLSSKYNIIPVLAPVDRAAVAIGTEYVDLDLANWISFLVSFGSLTSDDTDVVLITVECSTAASSNATEEAIGFTYRLSSAVATNSWAASTAGTTDGVGTAADGVNAAGADGKILEINVDPSVVAAKMADARYVRLWIAPTGPISILGAMALVETRYPGATIPSSS